MKRSDTDRAFFYNVRDLALMLSSLFSKKTLHHDDDDDDGGELKHCLPSTVSSTIYTLSYLILTTT